MKQFASLALIAALSGGTALAQDSESASPWERRVENTFAFVLNPLGIQNAFDVSWTKSITEREELIFKDAHVAAGVSNKLTPAFARVGGWFEYSPLSVLDLRVGVEPVYYFGTYKAFLPFARANSRFDDEVIEDRVDEAAAGFAGRVYVAPTLKGRVGSVVARIKTEVSWWRAQDKGKPFFYEPAWDTLIKAEGSTVLTVEALVLKEFKLSGEDTLLLGPVYDLTSVSGASVNRKQDVGLLAIWSKAGNLRALKDPTVAAKVIYFLQDPWRRHEPALQLAFVFGL